MRPVNGQLELTYCCNLDCIHCYCKGCEGKGVELKTYEWLKIIDEIHKEGCLWLTLTGGEPLIRPDFFDIYTHARNKGFLITIFTNGVLWDEEKINYLSEYPPYSIEITLNGIRKSTYESVTQVEGSFKKVMLAIERIVKNRLPLVLKCNGLKQNKSEVVKIKAFSQQILGPDKFKFDPLILPTLTGYLKPTDYRLSADEIREIEESDEEMVKQRNMEFQKIPKSIRGNAYIYQCNSWFNQFFIDPYARLKFCMFTTEFSVDLRRDSFKRGFYEIFPKVLEQEWKTNSKCKTCQLKAVCCNCPARAYLEESNEEAPVEYFCELAQMNAQRRENIHSRANNELGGVRYERVRV